MELTRRDAVAALAALGGTGGAAYGVRRYRDGDDAGESRSLPDDRQVRATMVAVAEVVYPDAVSGVEEFVTTFLDARLDRPRHGTALRRTVGQLNELATEWHDDRVPDLDPAARDDLLREVGADLAGEDPDGTTAERVRYYVVNELLLALYASPTGGDLVGIENPQGHPGGTDTYQRGPR